MIKKPIDLPRAWALALIVAVLLGAVFIRVFDIAHTPPGVAFDSTWDLADALRISRGFPFPAVFDTRPEPAYRWLLAGGFILFGPHVFSAQIVGIAFGIVTVALAYAAGLALLAGQSYRRIGALVAAGTVAANVPHILLSADLYRAILLPFVLLLATLLLLRAARSQRGGAWLAAGFASGLGLHTYIAGLLTPIWLGGFLIHQAIFSGQHWKKSLRNLLWTAPGLLVPLAIWAIFVRLVPDLFFRVGAASGSSPLSLSRVIMGYWRALPEFFLVGHILPMLNTPNTPYLNPLQAVLALIGLILAAWRWRTARGAILLGGLVVFIAPAALSDDPLHPGRLIGTLPFWALLTGWGAAALAAQISRPLPILRARQIAGAGCALLIAVSMGASHRAYQGMFADPQEYNPPDKWLGIPHNYTIALLDALALLEKVDQPTYVPLNILNTPAGAYMLQRERFPNVTTWARYGLKDLPAGQYFFPTYSYYHGPTPTDDPGVGLLLPAEKTIVILPISLDGPPVKEQISDQTRQITDDRGWIVARISPVAQAPFTPPHLSENASAPTFGSGLQLVGQSTSLDVLPGKYASMLLYWRVTAPQPTDIFSVAQLLDLNYGLYGNSDQPVWMYLYPSTRWQPGDIIPDLHSMEVKSDLPAGVYLWAVGVHVPPQTRRLLVSPPNASFNDLWLAGPVRAPRPQPGDLPADATPLDAHFEDHIALAGYKLVRGDTTWTLTLYWRVDAQPGGDYIIFVHAEAGGKIITQQDVKPFDGRLPTWSWVPGEVIATTFSLDVKAGAPDALYAGLYPYPSLERRVVTQSGSQPADRRAVIWLAH